jgi:hypothetical protein
MFKGKENKKKNPAARKKHDAKCDTKPVPFSCRWVFEK